ncbi:MAG: hypothetical protein WBM78_07060 [Desulfobacterales bacterium]
MIRIPTHTVPTHPSEMLLEEFLIPMGLTQKDLADTIAYKEGVSSLLTDLGVM